MTVRCKRQVLKGNYRFGGYRWTITKQTCVGTKSRAFEPKPGTTYTFKMTGPNLTEPYDPHPFKTRRAAERQAKLFAQGEVDDAKRTKRRWR